jgi:hypothetical protein
MAALRTPAFCSTCRRAEPLKGTAIARLMLDLEDTAALPAGKANHRSPRLFDFVCSMGLKKTFSTILTAESPSAVHGG